MNETIRIVPTEPKYVDACADIALRAWVPIYESFRRCLGDEIYELLYSDWQERKVTYTQTMHATGNALVALEGTRVVGYVSYLLKGERGQIVGNAVDPDMHGKGISRLLYTAAFDKMREAGCRFVQVNTGLDESHAPARRAYNKVGFEKNLPTVLYYQMLEPKAAPLPTCGNGVQVIPCQEEHLEDCVRITLTTWTNTHAIYTQHLGEKLHDMVHANWQEKITKAVRTAQSSGRGYVAVADGKVVGFASYRTEDTIGVIGYNAVDPQCRGRGIAGLLYGMLLNQMREIGCQCARVHTGLDAAHASARRAYEKVGFTKNLPEISYFMEL